MREPMGAPPPFTGLYGGKLKRLERERARDTLVEQLSEIARGMVSRLLADVRFRQALAALKAKVPDSDPFPPIDRAWDSRLRVDVRFRAGLPALKAELPDGDPLLRYEMAPLRLKGLMLLLLYVVTKLARRETREEFWTFTTGKKRKAIAEFPGRLRDMAEEVQRINRNSFLSPERSRKSEASLAKGLPAALCSYATWIDARVNEIAASRKHSRGHSPRVRHISLQVKSITGRFCDMEVAELLNAAELVLNPGDPKSGVRFDAQTLADLRCRQKKKLRRT